MLFVSLPSRGAWIEIYKALGVPIRPVTSLPSRGAWIEILKISCILPAASSLPSRGAWIEIITEGVTYGRTLVAPLAGSVDRNVQVAGGLRDGRGVAPLAGSVDRNVSQYKSLSLGRAVAPLAGSVDRNSVSSLTFSPFSWSLPSRGAWIEI